MEHLMTYSILNSENWGLGALDDMHVFQTFIVENIYPKAVFEINKYQKKINIWQSSNNSSVSDWRNKQNTDTDKILIWLNE